MRIPVLALIAASAMVAALALPAGATAATSAAAGTDGGGRRFDQPYAGFAPAGTVLRPASPRAAGLDPAPIAAFEEQVAAWADPASGAGYLFPGATSLMVHDGKVVERGATGYATRYSAPQTELPKDRWTPARTDTIYDLASLSKLFTSLVAVQQVEAGRIRLDSPVAEYLPEFAVNGKGAITVRQLLTHTSGLAPDPEPALWQGYPDIPSRVKAILDTTPVNPAGTTYTYSDLNMLTMQLVLEKVTGRSLDTLVREDITRPLHMTDTGYNPSASKLPRIAATEYEATPARGLVHGQVHDENAWAMGGVAGHAGVFSTVDDLAVLAQAILNGGTYRGHRVLSRHGVSLLEENFNQAFPGDSHGLGFELDQIWYMSGLSGPRTMGHTGFTGTSLVIDPESRSFAVLLTNRVHATRTTPSTNAARRGIAGALAQAMPVKAPGGGRSWFSGQGGGATTTLTTGPLNASGTVDVDFRSFVNTESTDRLRLEASSDGGATWQTVALRVTGTGAPVDDVASLSGQAVRAWWRVHAEVPDAASGLELRWRYTTDSVYEGRGVNLSGLRVTDGTHVLLDGDKPGAPLTSAGWRELPAGGGH